MFNFNEFSDLPSQAGGINHKGRKNTLRSQTFIVYFSYNLWGKPFFF